MGVEEWEEWKRKRRDREREEKKEKKKRGGKRRRRREEEREEERNRREKEEKRVEILPQEFFPCLIRCNQINSNPFIPFAYVSGKERSREKERLRKRQQFY